MIMRRMRRYGLIVSLNVAAIAFYVFIGIRMGFFTHMSATLFWSVDSNIYRDVANWLYGAGPNTVESKYRPFLFPLLLGAADRLGGATGIWVLNFLCWLGTVNLTAEAVRRMTGRAVLGAIAFMVLASNISLIVLSFQALTESTNALLESAWIVGLAVAAVPPARPRDIVLLLLPLTLMTVVRPGNEVVLLVGAVLLTVAIWRMPRSRGKAVLATTLCCLPLIFQVGLMAVTNHFFGLSAAGASQFKGYYASQVYASVNGLPSDLKAAQLEVEPMSNQELAAFLLTHPGASFHIFFSNLRQNLTSGSNFIDIGTLPTLAAAVRRENKVYVILDLIFVPIVAIAIAIRRDVRLVLLSIFLALLIGLCSLINTQGDRYVDMAVHLWAAAYALAASDLLPFVSQWVVHLRHAVKGAA